MKKKLLFSVIATLFTSPVFAEDLQLDDVTVKSSGFERKDTETTYTSEIHTAKQIEASGASTLYDFLAQQSSLNILSSFGNKATPSINLRGFGSENGAQNVVITLNGQRLNNIDSSSQLLAGIPLSNIERIEISKGSGSVLYGDGATAGAIQIYTKAKTGVTASTSWGNFGQQNHYASAGLNEEKLELSANLSHDSHDGFGKKDPSGYRDEFTSNTQNARVKIKPTDSFRIFAEATSTRNDIRYAPSLTKAQFKDSPRNVGLDFLGNPANYTHQALDSDRWQIGTEIDLSPSWHVTATHYREDKLSEFYNFNSKFHYDQEASTLDLRYDGAQISAITGIQVNNGERKASNNSTTKNNRALFANLEYRLLDNLTLSAGARTEKVSYQFSPNSGNSLADSENLSAWDIGANYRINPEVSVFANHNHAYQAPDIDRFFTTNVFTGVTSFNGFIKPMHSKTSNLGLNYVTDRNRLKMSAFYADLNNEIYVIPLLFTNTNLDQSHKYGLELQDSYKINPELTASVLYNYIRATIDRENTGSGSFNGKNLPGVPRHNLVANLNWKFNQNASLNVNHAWRSSAYAYQDFANNLGQKQSIYSSTNLSLNYQYSRFTIFTAVNNLFEHENSIQVADDSIYPVDFVRTWRVGLKADF
jgi:iron complex outermembrane receptor protein